MTIRTTDTLAVERIGRIRQLLEECRWPLVVSHVDPDGDAIGTQLAFGRYLEKLGKPVIMMRDSDIPSKYLFLPGVEMIVAADGFKSRAEFDVAVVLECPGPSRLGAVAGYIGENTRVINLDHHPDNSLEAEVSWVDVSASSVGELAYDYFRHIGFNIDDSMATQLYTAILTDTGRFRFESTRPHTLMVAAELVRAGAEPRTICDRIYYDMDPGVVKLTGQVLGSLEYHYDGRICIMLLTQQMAAQCGISTNNTEGLVDYSLYTRGVLAGALLREIDSNTTKASLRSRNGIDVAAIASRFGGGGHSNAAGCTIRRPLDQARREIVRLLGEANES